MFKTALKPTLLSLFKMFILKYLGIVVRFMTMTLIAVIVPLNLAALAEAIKIEPIQLGEIHTIKSETLDEQRTIWISAPDDYKTDGLKYPVIYLTDADQHFIHMASSAKLLAHARMIPEMIVVGISNPKRDRDLSPPITEEMGNFKNGQPKPVGPQAGGADRFLEFMAKDLFPYIERHFPTGPYRILAGHSSGGLLTIHAFVNHNDLFQGYIAASPALWWNNGSLIQQTEDFLTAHKDLKKQLYVTLGDEGEVIENGHNDIYDMHHWYEKLIQGVEGTAGNKLIWGTKLMPHLNHNSVPLPSYYQGLVKFFEGWVMPREILNSGDAAALAAHMANFSDRIGSRIPVSAAAVAHVGRRMLRRDKIEQAIALYTYNVEQHPNVDILHYILGTALEKDGQWEKARTSYRKSVELAEKNQSGRRAQFEKFVKDITAKIAESSN